MPIIRHDIFINAPIHVCFDLARNVDVHTETTKKTKERAIGGVTKGLMQKGDTVTWEATHLGIKQTLTAKIIEMKKPYQFTDVMVKGAFHSFTHVHEFIESGTGTILKDTFTYQSPLGMLGVMADKVFLEKYMRNFIVSRAIELKRIAEKERRGPSDSGV
ncbi:SRPBCC family protein [Rossellomorea vietnamensis]|uniref:SRPBCC family protein n=1 Tax=Rossellomorea vietnamensis TaxID=218284 RepID=UPI001CCF4CC4|nr:SRPBCC family protein [Rossellomorea vietnamensis]MCA0150432.1 SRPBCC family protein [Rossellomorea vietnamensis]